MRRSIVPSGATLALLPGGGTAGGTPPPPRVDAQAKNSRRCRIGTVMALALGFVLCGAVSGARAVTLSFQEGALGQPPLVGLSGSNFQIPDVVPGGATNRLLSGNTPENTAVGLNTPLLFFTTSADTNGQQAAIALLAESPASGLSDIVEVGFTVSGGLAAVQLLFGSYDPAQSLPLAGFPVVVENGGLQDVTGSFVGFPSGVPTALPAGLTILVQSAPVPEPASAALLVVGLLGLGAARTAWRRAARVG